MPFSASASSSALSSDSTPRALERWLKQKVTYEACSEIPNISKKELRVFVESTVREGVFELKALNPSFTLDRLSHWREKPVHISCGLTTEQSPADLAFPIPLIRPFAVIRIGTTLQSPRYSVRDKQAMFFHEFLHLMAFDNQTEAQHNACLRAPSRGDITCPEQDTVYTCSVAAFPDTAWLFGGRVRPKVAIDFCSHATVIDGRVTSTSL